MIEVRGLIRRLGETLVLDGLTFDAAPGEITGFLGPNGAGKTTTMRVLGTLLRPHGGTVRIADYDVDAEPQEVRRVMGLVTEEASLLDRLTVREQLEIWSAAHGLRGPAFDERLEEMVELLGLGDYVDERAGRLSKGTRQKAAVARALVHDPPVLLLDEPTANLDVVATGAMLDLLGRPEIRTGKTVIFATHRLEEAEDFADRVVGIVHGRTVVTGTPAEIAREADAGGFREGFLRILGRAELERETA